MNEAPDPIPAFKQQLAQMLLVRLDPYDQGTIGRWLRVDQPRVSDLQHGRLGRFSLQQLVRFAARIQGEIGISVTWTTPTPRVNRPRSVNRAKRERGSLEDDRHRARLWVERRILRDLHESCPTAADRLLCDAKRRVEP